MSGRDSMHNITQHHITNLVLDDIIEDHHVTRSYTSNPGHKSPYHGMQLHQNEDQFMVILRR